MHLSRYKISTFVLDSYAKRHIPYTRAAGLLGITRLTSLTGLSATTAFHATSLVLVLVLVVVVTVLCLTLLSFRALTLGLLSLSRLGLSLTLSRSWCNTSSFAFRLFLATFYHDSVTLCRLDSTIATLDSKQGCNDRLSGRFDFGKLDECARLVTHDLDFDDFAVLVEDLSQFHLG